MEIGDLYVGQEYAYEKIKEEGGISYFIIEDFSNVYYSLFYLTKVVAESQEVVTTMFSPSPELMQ